MADTHWGSRTIPGIREAWAESWQLPVEWPWASFLALLKISVFSHSQGCMSSHRTARVSAQHCSLADGSVHRSTDTGDLPHTPATASLSDFLSRSLTTIRKHTETGLSPPPFVCHTPNNATYICQPPLESIWLCFIKGESHEMAQNLSKQGNRSSSGMWIPRHHTC